MRPGSPIPIRRPADDARLPLKKQREEYLPLTSAPGPGPSTSEYHPRGVKPGSSFSAGPPLTTGSSAVTGGGEREYRKDRADEYAAPPPGGAANSYERPRSPTGGGAGSAPMQSYGGRGRYSGPSHPHDRGYMPPLPSRS